MFDNINWKKLAIEKGSIILLTAIGGVVALFIYNAYQNKKFSNILSFSKKETDTLKSTAPATAAAATGSAYHGNVGQGIRERLPVHFPHPRV
jgi:hypothetical protein